MKHRIAMSAALVAAALSLAACAPDATINPSESASAPSAPTAFATVPAVDAAEALAGVEWTDNGADTAPTLEFEAPINFIEPGSLIVEEGDGAAIVENQMLGLHYVALSGTDSSLLYSTYDTGAPEQIQLVSGQLDPALFEALSNVNVGARILYGVPDQGTGAVVMAVTVVDATDVLTRAEGAAVAPVAGLPVVTLAADGKPSVAYDGATKPTSLIAQDLITGTGPAVEEGQAITIHYTGWVYDGEQFDSSWDRSAAATFTLASGQLIDGWVQGLVGKSVGSQVLLVIPPELGYGADGNGEAIPGDSTLVFVVDILAAN